MSSERLASSGATLRVVGEELRDGAVARAVLDEERLAAVRATGLLGSPPEPAFDDLVELARTVTGARHAAFTLVDAHRSYRKTACGPGLATGDVAGGPGPCSYVVALDAPLVVPDVAADARLRDSVSCRGVGALCCVPVRDEDGLVVGTLWAGDPAPRPWGTEEVRALRAVARALGHEVRLRGRPGGRSGVGPAGHPSALDVPDEVRGARALQRSLLPAALPDVPDAAVGCAHRAAGTAGAVNGDFYDLFAAGNHWCVSIGDVAGRGIDAARRMALARYTIRCAAAHHPDPRAVLERLHRELLLDDDDAFVTATVAVLRPDGAGGLIGTLGSGGHEPALVRRADGAVEALNPRGTLLGLTPRPAPPPVPLHLTPGDLLLLYTDGVTAARPGPGGECFGDRRLADLLDGCRGLDAQDVVDRVMDAVVVHADGSDDDDVAVLAVQALPRPSGT